MTRPNFIAIGPGKCGTTWMYRVLRGHPEVCVSSAKETLFFETEHHRGEDWYARFFAHCTKARAIGEVSNTYVFCPRAAERIYNFDSRMRIVSSLRDPIDRAFSHYLFMRRNGQVRGSFEEVIQGQRPDLLTRGLYGHHLEPWLDHFPRQRILILLFDELSADPSRFARRLFEFLGVDPNVEPEWIDRKALGASRPRSRIVARVVNEAAALIRHFGFPELVTQVKESWVPRLLYSTFTEGDKPRIDPATRDRLQEYFRSDLERASGWVGIDLVGRWFDGRPAAKGTTFADR